MKVSKVNRTNITSSLHLRNLFVSDAYLELGIIDTNIISSLLKYKMINLNDITYFPVQNKGLGHSDIQTTLLKNYLPHLFFMNLAKNNPQCQLYISYGLLRYRGIESKESFMPVILLPVKFYFENLLDSENDESFSSALNDIFVQMIDTPIINPSIYSIIGLNKLNNVSNEYLQTIEGLDYILSQLDNYEEYSLSLDNFLTFASKKSNETIYPRRKKNNIQYSQALGIDKLYRIDPSIYMQRVYDKEQKIFIERFVNGEDLTLTGYNGSGKTSILKDIIVNNLAKGLRTLYISNNQESINDVYHFLKVNNLDRYTANFTQSFRMLSSHEYSNLFLDDVAETNEYIKTLNEYYDKLEQYENDFNKSFRDFKLTEIITNYFKSNRELITVDKNYIDDLSGIYKHEYEIIYHSIKSLERNTQNIGSFKNSIWNAIPIVNNIKHLNEVISIVSNLNDDFKKLRNLEIKLNEFGVKDAESFSMLKTLNEPIDIVKEGMIPIEWQKSLSIYEKAISKCSALESDIKDYHDILDDINSKYINLLDLDIKNEIKLLYGAFYKKSNENDINSLLEDKELIKKYIIESRISLNDFNANTSKLSSILKWDFLSKDDYFIIIRNLSNLFNKYYINGKMLNIILNNKVDEEIKELNYIYQTLNNLDTDMRTLEKIEPRLINLNFDKKNIDYENDEFRTYDAKYKKAKKLSKEYIDICGISHKHHDNNINAITALKEFYESIKANKYRKLLVEYLQNIEDSGFVEFLITSNIINRAYQEINRLIDFFKQYGFNTINDSYFGNAKRFSEYLDYIENLYSSNERIKEKIINNTNPFACVSVYYEMEKHINKYNNEVDYFVNNEEYKNLFGYMYNNEKTDVQAIKDMAVIYRNYINVFVSEDSVYESFVKYDDLRVVVNRTKERLDSIVENIKQYSLKFKDSVKRYYDSKIEDNVEYFTTLLDSKNELNLYLNITSEIGVLNEYHLTKLIGFVEKNDDITGLSDVFEAYYFQTLVDQYFSNKGYLFNTDGFIELLEKARGLEDIVCQFKAKKFINNYIKKNPVRISKKEYDDYDYQGFLFDNNRRLKIFLSDVSFANKFYKSINYDCIIIDDAHIITYGDISNLLKNKRYVVSGDYQSNKSLNINLISSLSEIDVTLKNRYELGPRNLTLEYPCKAPYLSNHKDNLGVEVLNKNINEYIYKLYKKDNNVKINYFIKDIDYQKRVYEELAQAFLDKNVNEYDIFDFLNNNICIVDINSRNYNKSDYNIIYLKDYYTEDSIVVSNNIYSTLTLAHKKLVIYNDCDLLEAKSDNPSEIMIKLKLLLKNNNPYLKNIIDSTVMKAENEFLAIGYKYRYPGNGINAILEKEDGEFISLVCLFSNGNVTDILSFYRLLYEQYHANNEKIVFTSLIDLLEQKELYAQKVQNKIKKL